MLGVVPRLTSKISIGKMTKSVQPRVEYGYKEYATPRRAIFSVEKANGRYILGSGYEQELVEETIIGEDSTAFVTKIIESSHGRWIGNKVVSKTYLLPVGIHKTRLVQWLDGQLNLF